MFRSSIDLDHVYKNPFMTWCTLKICFRISTLQNFHTGPSLSKQLRFNSEKILKNQPCLLIHSRVDWKIKFAFVLEITLKVFWDATREESVLVRFNRPNNKIIFHNEPLIATTSATTSATKSATKNQRGSLWSENQRCNVMLVLLMVFSMVETRGISLRKCLTPWSIS